MTLNPDIQDVARKEPPDTENVEPPYLGKTIDGPFVFGVIADLERYADTMTAKKRMEFYKKLVRRLIMRFPSHAGLEIQTLLRSEKC